MLEHNRGVAEKWREGFVDLLKEAGKGANANNYESDAFSEASLRSAAPACVAVCKRFAIESA